MEAAGAEWLHVDVMDGHFVPNLTIGPLVVRAIRQTTRLPLDVHLMITHPERLIPAFAEAGADMITVHMEACVHLDRTLGLIRSLNKRSGVALNPHTLESTIEYVLPSLDLILVMSVNPGFGGQTFIPAVLPKIAALRRSIEQHGRHIDLSVDGGINPQTARLAKEAGADVLVSGNSIFGSTDYAQAIEALRLC